MNPSLQLLLVLLISFEVSFTSRLTANLVFLVIVIFVLLAHRLHWRQWLWLLAGPFLPALALFVTIVFYSPGHDWHFGFVLVSRIYLYVMLGATVTFTTTPLKLAQSLEQTAHLPAKFAYGTLSAVNLLPKIKQEVIQIRAAALMRGVTLHLWSPTLYFKAILVAINWSDQLAQAIESHGFVEGKQRTFAHPIAVHWYDWALLGGGIIILQVLLIAFP